VHGALDLLGDRREQEFMVFVMVLVAAATFLAIGAIADWMSLPGPTLPTCVVHQIRQLSEVLRTCKSDGRHSRF